MPNPKKYWVHKRLEGGYTVKRAGGARASARTETQAETWNIVREPAEITGRGFLDAQS